MIGKVIGAVLGAQAAEHTNKLGGASGAAAGVLATMLLRRLSLPALATIAVGGYAFKKLSERGDRGATATPDQKPAKPATAAAI